VDTKVTIRAIRCSPPPVRTSCPSSALLWSACHVNSTTLSGAGAPSLYTVVASAVSVGQAAMCQISAACVWTERTAIALLSTSYSSTCSCARCKNVSLCAFAEGQQHKVQCTTHRGWYVPSLIGDLPALFLHCKVLWTRPVLALQERTSFSSRSALVPTSQAERSLSATSGTSARAFSFRPCVTPRSGCMLAVGQQMLSITAN
jgi:hypothetical protein